MIVRRRERNCEFCGCLAAIPRIRAREQMTHCWSDTCILCSVIFPINEVQKKCSKSTAGTTWREHVRFSQICKIGRVVERYLVSECRSSLKAGKTISASRSWRSSEPRSLNLREVKGGRQYTRFCRIRSKSSNSKRGIALQGEAVETLTRNPTRISYVPRRDPHTTSVHQSHQGSHGVHKCFFSLLRSWTRGQAT